MPVMLVLDNIDMDHLLAAIVWYLCFAVGSPAESELSPQGSTMFLE